MYIPSTVHKRVNQQSSEEDKVYKVEMLSRIATKSVIKLVQYQGLQLQINRYGKLNKSSV